MPNFVMEMLWRCNQCKHENLGRNKKCAGCGKAIKGEVFYDSDAVESFDNRVTDVDLIEKAKGGADWQCRFCSSHQFRIDGSCAECGADQGESRDTVTKWDDGSTGAGGGGSTLEEDLRAQDKEDRKHQPQHTAQPRLKRLSVRAADVVDNPVRPDYSYLQRSAVRLGVIVAAVALIATLGYFLFRTRIIDASVTRAEWAHIVHVERYRPHNDAGFNGEIPPDAYDVTGEGNRHHHYIQVQDGTKTEHYKEACGQNCHTTPKSCHKTSVRCSSGKNGFKSCSGGDTVCSGGDRVCSTKYCERSRQVPKYKDVSVTAPYYSWKVMRWSQDRDIAEKGVNNEPFWPSAEKVNLNCCGFKERSTTSYSYTTTFTDTDGHTHSYTPKSESEFNSLKVGTKRRVKTRIIGANEVMVGQ